METDELTAAAAEVLEVIRRSHAATVVGLQIETGRSNSWLWNALHELQAAGLVVAEPMKGDRTGGRPRNVYRAQPRSPE